MPQSRILIPTKFAPPRLSTRSIPRQGLLQRLHQLRHCSLVLVTGPAGFGKTTLLAQWRKTLMKSGARVVWLSLAQEERRFAAFWTHLTASLHHEGVALEDNVLLLHPDASGSVQTVAAALIQALSRVPGELYLMIDDFHHADDPQTFRLVQTLVDCRPENLHLVLATRASPAMPLGRLRAAGLLGEIECADLPFDFGETTAFLRDHVEGSLDVNTVQMIQELTDGWPIGMQLVSVALKANPGSLTRLRSLVVKTGNLHAYLTEDVIGHLPAALVDFMEKISILRRFNTDVAGYVAETDDAARLIGTMEQQNLFILPVDFDDGCQWYRLHPVFADYLGERIARSPGRAARLHLRASRWYADHMMLAEALRHASRCADPAQAIELVDRAAPPMADLGDLGNALRWVESLQLDLVRHHPRLLLLGCWTYALTNRLEKAGQWIQALQQSPESGSESITHQITLLNALLAVLREDAETSLELLERTPQPEIPFLQQVRAALLITALSQMGRHAEAHSTFHAFSNLHRGNPEMGVLPATTAAAAALLEGDVLRAQRISASALGWAEKLYGRRSGSAAGAGVVLAAALYEADRPAEAREVLANRLDVVQHSTPYVLVNGVLCQARLQYLESPPAALSFLAEQEAAFRTRGLDWATACVLAERLRIAAQMGDMHAATRLLMALDALAAQHRDATGIRAGILALAAQANARGALLERRPEQALRYVAQLQDYGVQQGRGRPLVTADMLSAIAFDMLGRQDAAAVSLTSALAAGYRMGLVRTFTDEGARLGALFPLLGLTGDGPTDAYRQCVAASFRPYQATPAPAVATTGMPAPQESRIPESLGLTKRESEILVLLEQAMSNKRIAATLNLSPGTVKWNIKNIFAKLGVSSRYEAIVLARQQRGER
ncbi:hypothetical protein UB46_40110 [Burkholderiaceae bacterium 16]|nr:hypothetical protein UB46_40110 [Burkholderiaceae bacterium 16]